MVMVENNLSCFLYGPQDARFEKQPVPQLSDPYEVLVKIAYTGVCGSDVHFWLKGGVNHKVSPDKPLIMGHEAAGTIHKVGALVKNLQPGDRVAIEPGFPCRRCDDCKRGYYNLCPEMQFAASPGPGPAKHGTLTKLFPIPADFCYKLPSSVSLEEGVLVEPLAVAVAATRLVNVKAGHNVVVFGAGPVGLLCCAVSKDFGASQAVVVDVNDKRLDFASEFAATDTYNPDPNFTAAENAERIKAKFDLGPGADTVIEATGAEPCIHTGIFVLRRGGSLVQAGLGNPMISFPIVELVERQVHMTGCFRYGPGSFDHAIDMLKRGTVDLKKLITKVVDFHDAPEAWETMKRGEGIKTLIKGLET